MFPAEVQMLYPSDRMRLRNPFQPTMGTCRRGSTWPVAAIVIAGAALASNASAAPSGVAFTQSVASVDAYDFVEITASVANPGAGNPFTDASLSGSFEMEGRGGPLQVDGFCDSPDGKVYRIRFMPASEGNYRYAITYRQGSFLRTHAGTFRAVNGHRRGPIRIDPRYRWHFMWEGTGEHYFFNGTTAYWLTGWSDERIIRNSIQRLHRLKVNRIRVTVAGRG